MKMEKGLVITIGIIIVSLAITGGVISQVHLESPANAMSVSTNIEGISTNAVNKVVGVNGVNYSQSTIGNYKALGNNIDSSYMQSQLINSTVELNLSNFINGNYAVFNVTITNMGISTIYFNDSYNGIITNNNTAVPSIVTFNMSEFKSTSVSLSQFKTSLSNANGWITEIHINKVPSELKQGQTLTYSIYTGLGEKTVKNVSNDLNVSIPLLYI